jgi:glutaredoxin 3
MSLIVYTKAGCSWCEEVVKFLDERQVDYEDRNVTEDEGYFDELKVKSGQEKCPTLDLNGEILTDAGVEEVEGFLKEKGIL